MPTQPPASSLREINEYDGAIYLSAAFEVGPETPTTSKTKERSLIAEKECFGDLGGTDLPALAESMDTSPERAG
jgi:hypothetical protein